MKLALGTAQFGLNYGIANTRGQVPYSEVLKILNIAKNHSINTLDTATEYGNSESVLGEATTGDDFFKLITKTPHLHTQERATKQILSAFKKSISHLQTHNIYALLVHKADDIIGKIGAEVWNTMRQLRDSGQVKKIGISVYNQKQIETILSKHNDVDILQVPLNIFDQRLIHNNYLEHLVSQGIEIHCRSVFLQGLLLMDLNAAITKLPQAAPYIKTFHNDCEKHKITPLQMALKFVLQQKSISKLLVGVTSAKELEEILQNANKDLPVDIDFSKYNVNDLNIIDPTLWT
ncbi:MAG: aldo/keto reductase [Gammaproteobacteria bacterium]|nr:aldo/keto reductase [Gammaproteobacteria bacterium]